MRFAESWSPARLVLSLTVAIALVAGASSAIADPPSAPQGTAGASQGAKESGPGKNCLCYGNKHDGPLKDLCVKKCRCPGQCGKEGARRPGSSAAK
ncbi:MAG: hypothetical protein AB7I68_06655 [Porticoccaceae bacterium]